MGFDKFEQFLAGGRETDQHFAKATIEKNIPALMALAGVWNTNFLGSPTHAVLPYSNALRLLPAYLQQLEMESNGKRVERAGRVVDYATCPVVWGAEGTPSQHSFHQLLHQGTQVVPCDFIDIGSDEILSANARAQADALAFGSEDGQYPGNRPSSMLFVDGMNARNLGRLLALYEHKVFVQGVIWNINSFDQPGVELGKIMAKKLLATKVPSGGN
jgi:glucose-6-phosphate isomerase